MPLGLKLSIWLLRRSEGGTVEIVSRRATPILGVSTAGSIYSLQRCCQSNPNPCSLSNIHTIAHGATIKLHEPLTNDHVFARTKALSAVRAIVDILVKTDVPKVGVCWLASGHPAAAC
ncbi:hypothetical protein B0H14DRAFT_3484631 [Mycena olivaceomarginata]|nr:hypothetical protein B0H14DRAFT_3484631 [Mycena olivaceomarginata]